MGAEAGRLEIPRPLLRNSIPTIEPVLDKRWKAPKDLYLRLCPLPKAILCSLHKNLQQHVHFLHTHTNIHTTQRTVSGNHAWSNLQELPAWQGRQNCGSLSYRYRVRGVTHLHLIVDALTEIGMGAVSCHSPSQEPTLAVKSW